LQDPSCSNYRGRNFNRWRRRRSPAALRQAFRERRGRAGTPPTMAICGTSFGDDRTRRDDRAPPDPDAAADDHVGSYPDVILYEHRGHDMVLEDHQPVRLHMVMVGGNDHRIGADHDSFAYGHAAAGVDLTPVLTAKLLAEREAIRVGQVGPGENEGMTRRRLACQFEESRAQREPDGPGHSPNRPPEMILDHQGDEMAAVPAKKALPWVRHGLGRGGAAHAP